MKIAESLNDTPEPTAFVREVVLPGIGGATPPRPDPRSCRFKLRGGTSPIHRWGIFAAEKIPARRRVIEYTGQKIDAREVRRRSVRPHLYIFRVNQKWAVDGAVGGSGAEFINHSCRPNLYSVVGAGGRIFFLSARRIEAGEELTLDYNLEGDTPDLPCSCGARNCKGIINRAENEAA